ncbi:hypothetical protein AB0R12_41130, partial [Streptomyces niveus]|uniref:hypothetical protein n=1 Tax=Streptomyces niveus TaxID=193462 RepID=UPI00341E7E81
SGGYEKVALALMRAIAHDGPEPPATAVAATPPVRASARQRGGAAAGAVARTSPRPDRPTGRTAP